MTWHPDEVKYLEEQLAVEPPLSFARIAEAFTARFPYKIWTLAMIGSRTRSLGVRREGLIQKGGRRHGKKDSDNDGQGSRNEV